MVKLALRNLTKTFDDFVAVDDVTLELEHGEFVSLLGPSGCGKTTTLRMIAGFIRPSGGIIEMDGESLSTAALSVPPERRRMSMIFQSYAIWPNMTVAENVAFGLHVRKLPASQIRSQVDAMLEVVHLAHLRDRYPAELSGGQQQRVALARAMVVRPEVLLLDEPLSNLDANLREEMRYEIRRLHNEFRITTVYVTHDQSEAMAASDRIVVMNAGRIEQVADPFTLYNKPRTHFVAGFIGRTNFLEGKCGAEVIDFGDFALNARLLDGIGGLDGDVLFSVRPQNILLHATAPVAENESWLIEARVVERAYLGDFWDYLVVPEGGDTRIRVSTVPKTIAEIGSKVWLEVDPSHVVPVIRS